MKLWGAVRSQAGKVAFEADKMVRARREEGAINDANSEIARQMGELGKLVLGLYRNGALAHPQIEPFSQAVAGLEEKIAQLTATVAAIKAEVYVEGGQTAQPQSPGNTGYIPAAPAAPEPAPAATVPCSNCGAQISPNAAFCPECGQKVTRP